MKDDRLSFALPSKGRLHERTLANLVRVGLSIRRFGGERAYAVRIDGFACVNPVLRTAQEIALDLGRGKVHLGVTGADLLYEGWSEGTRRVASICPFGFGRTRLLLAVPQCWRDVQNLEDFEEAAVLFRATHRRPMRIATKYPNLARAFLHRNGVNACRLAPSGGATEGAVAASLAEAIVDISSTGATLEANGLKPVGGGVIMESEAHLFASREAQWNGKACSALRRFVGKLSGTFSGAGENCEVFLRSLARDKATPARV